MGLPLTLQTVERMLQDDIRSKLPEINCPTLVVSGEHDPFSPEVWTKEVAALVKRGRYRIISGAAHCLSSSTPHQLTRLLLEFIYDAKGTTALNNRDMSP